MVQGVSHSIGFTTASATDRRTDIRGHPSRPSGLTDLYHYSINCCLNDFIKQTNIFTIDKYWHHHGSIFLWDIICLAPIHITRQTLLLCVVSFTTRRTIYNFDKYWLHSKFLLLQVIDSSWIHYVDKDVYIFWYILISYKDHYDNAINYWFHRAYKDQISILLINTYFT